MGVATSNVACGRQVSTLKYIIMVPACGGTKAVSRIVTSIDGFASSVVIMGSNSASHATRVLSSARKVRIVNCRGGRNGKCTLGLKLGGTCRTKFECTVAVSSSNRRCTSSVPIFLSHVRRVPSSLLVKTHGLATSGVPSGGAFTGGFSGF